MKHIKLFEDFISEGVKYESGRGIVSEWSGTATSEKEFIEMIKRMPETLKSIVVTNSTSSFNPSREKFEGPIDSAKKNKIIKIVKDITKAFKKQGDEITAYELMSFYGVSNAEKHNTDPAYIQYRTEKISSFNRDMSAGRYGSLD